MKTILRFLVLGILSMHSFQAFSQNFNWANLIEGIDGRAYVHRIEVDNNGDIVIFGSFRNVLKLKGGATPLILSNPDKFSYFLAKYDNVGNLYWAKQMATVTEPTFDNQAALAINAGNDIFIAAPFNDDMIIEGTTLVSGGGIESFIAKFDTDGNIDANYPRHLNSTTVLLRDIAVTNTGDFFVMGNFNGLLNLGGGVTVSSIGSSDIFVARYNSLGIPLNAFAIQSIEYDEGVGIEFDNSNGVFISGIFRGPLNFNVGGTPTLLTPNATSNDDFFVAHHNGVNFSWVKHGTGAGQDVIRDMHVNLGLDAVYVTGSFTNVLTVESSVTAAGGLIQEDVFVLKLNASSGNQDWLVGGGGNSNDRAYGITESGGTVFVAGRMLSTATFGGFTLSSPFTSVTNAIVLSLDNASGNFTAAVSVDSDDNNSGAFDIATDGAKNYLAGEYVDVIAADIFSWATGANSDFFVMTTNNADLSIDGLYGSYYYKTTITDSHADDSGLIFVTGTMRGYYELYLMASYVSVGNDDVFVAQYGSDGVLNWIEFGGGPGQDVPHAIIVNQARDEVFLTGTFEGTMNIAGDNIVGNPVSNVFIAKYDFSGPLWGVAAATSVDALNVNDVATDNLGNVLITGDKGPALTLFNGASNNTGVAEYFLAKYDGSGNNVWIKTGPAETGEAVATDSNNDVLVTGLFDLNAIFEGQPIVTNGIEDVFVAKYLSNGTFQWIRTGGSSNREAVRDVATDAGNNVYVTGYFFGTANFGGTTLNGTDDDVFLIKYNSGGVLQWARSGGGAGRDEPEKIIIDPSNNVVLTGYFRGDATFDCVSFTGLDPFDAEIFILKYDANGTLFFGTHFGNPTFCDECTNSDRPFGFGMDASENFYLTGRIAGPTSFGSISVPAKDEQFNYFITRLTIPPGTPCAIVVCSVTPTVNAGTDQFICLGTSLQLSGVIGGSAVAAQWTSSGDGTFNNSTALNATYQPGTADETNGTVSLTLTVAAAGACPQVSDQMTLTISRPINAAGLSQSVSVQQPATIDVLASATVNAGDAITLSVIQNPGKGNATVNADNTITYVANAGTVGPDSFQYRICNQCDLCSTATVSLDIRNVAPVITPPTAPLRTVAGQRITFPFASFLSDINNNINYSSIQIVNGPTSGAAATFDTGFNLVIDYANTNFIQTDALTIEVCDLMDECSRITLQIEVSGEIIVHNGISPNGDAKNDYFMIENIQYLEPQNKVTLFNRWGDKVFEIQNYDNDTRRFDGRQSNGSELPSGVYFFKIEFSGNREAMTGYLTLKK